MNKLFTELRRRNIFRVAGVYAVTGWILSQASGVLEEALNLPSWFDTIVVVLVLIGFPIAILLAWAFEMTPEGMKRTESVEDGDSIAAKTGRKLDFAILAGLILVAGVVVGNRFLPQKAATPEITQQTQTPITNEIDEKPSIAVMPFEDFSAAKDQEYFARGISEELLNVLSRIDGLKVSSRTSSFAFKEREASTGEIAEALGVKHILEGSIRKSGTTLRITAQLIDTSTDQHMWSETYDRPLTADNIFAIQDEIAAAIVAELKGRLSLAPIKQAPRTSSLEAYELYLRARIQMNQRKPETLRAAEAGFKQVITLDPEFAPAYSGLADTYMLMISYTDMREEESLKLARPNVERALQLAPNSAESLTTASMLANQNNEFEKAVAFADRAIAANPNHADAYLRKFNALSSTYNGHEHLAIIEKARILDPLSPVILSNLGYTQLRIGDRAGARQTMADNARWNPDSLFGFGGLAGLDYQDGKYASAHSLLKDAQALNPEDVRTQNSLANLYMDVAMYDTAFATSKQSDDRAIALLLMGKRQQSLKLALDNEENGNPSYILYMHGNLEDAYPHIRKLVIDFNVLGQAASIDTAEMFVTLAYVMQKNGDGDADIFIGKLEAYLGTGSASDKILGLDLITGIKLQMLKGDTDAAYIWLDRYLDLGFADIPLLKEPIFDTLRGTPEFEQRVSRMAKNAAKYRTEIEAQLANPKPNWVKDTP